MFKEKTVIILGAGGSFEYGMPLGEKLVSDIGTGVSLATANGYTPHGRHSTGVEFKNRPFSVFYSELFSATKSSSQPNYIQEFANIIPAQLEKFTAFGHLIQNTHQSSIDAILADNEEFADVGKSCIAVAIISAYLKNYTAQDFSALSRTQMIALPQRSFSRAENPRSWYAAFAEEITSGATSAEDIENSNLNIVTFNYDMICEQALQHYIKSSSKFSNVNLNKVFRVHHVYGNINPEIPDQSYSSDMCSRITAASLKSGRALRVVRERTSDQTNLQIIEKVINDAKRIFIIGFSFDETNVELLGLKKPGIGKKITAMNFGDVAKINLILEDLNVPESKRIVRADSIFAAIRNEGLFLR